MSTTAIRPDTRPFDPQAQALALRLQQLGFVGLLVALVWAPWPLGSNRPWAVALLAAIVWASLALAAVGAALQVQPQRKTVAGAWVPVAALLGFAALAVLQLVPGLGPNGGPISIDPFHTRRYLLITLLYLGAWLLVLLTVNTRERGERLLAALLAAGLLQALAAVLLYSAGGRYELWYAQFDQGGRAMGTFVNPDDLAGYMELTLSAGLGWLLSQLGTGEPDPHAHWRTRVVAALTFMMSGKMLLRLTLVVLVIALVMTHSRMGNGAFFISMGLTGALVAWRSKRLRRPALWLVASMAVVDLFIIGQWVGLERVVQRLQDTAEASSETIAGFGLANAQPPREESLAQRLEVPRLSLQLVAQNPWLGQGGGTYYTAFPPLKRAGLPWHWDHAHNDYVQVACDMGLLGLALWMGVGVASAWRSAQLLRDDVHRVNRGLGVAATMALCCLGLHSMVDFNLHIPANALTFTVLLAAVWAVPAELKKRRSGASRSARPQE
jgi:O-antigen ligase